MHPLITRFATVDVFLRCTIIFMRFWVGEGTGKSSVALTIRQKMITSDCTDILLPIITPEVISEQECSILGWVLSATETVLHQLENRMKQLHTFSQGKMKCPPKVRQYLRAEIV